MASQTEIARRAGVSQSVVSRVLNGHAERFGIAVETAARIRTLATELNYRPHPAASMLLGGATKLIGVLVRSFDDPYLATILQELNRGALASGHTLLVVGLDGDDQHRADEVRLLHRYRPDALIVVGSTDFSRWPDDLFPSGKPVVQIGLPSPDPRILTCGIDEPAAAAAIVAHLLARGHRRFAIVSDNCLASLTRRTLVREALFTADPSATLTVDFLSPDEDAAAGAQGAAQLLTAPTTDLPPTAIIATGDLIALGLLRALANQGRHAPADFALASYDDLPVAALLRPALTTIRQPARDLAAAAMAISTDNAPAASITLAGELIVRESSAISHPTDELEYPTGVPSIN